VVTYAQFLPISRMMASWMPTSAIEIHRREVDEPPDTIVAGSRARPTPPAALLQAGRVRLLRRFHQPDQRLPFVGAGMETSGSQRRGGRTSKLINSLEQGRRIVRVRSNIHKQSSISSTRNSEEGDRQSSAPCRCRLAARGRITRNSVKNVSLCGQSLRSRDLTSRDRSPTVGAVDRLKTRRLRW
jgi:hypothetical protein